MATATKRKPEEKLVTLINKRKRMIPYNLAGEHMRDFRAPYGYLRVTQNRTEHDPETGVLGLRRGRATVPSAITFCAREKRENLPQAITRCPEVDAAIKRGDLKCIYQEKRLGETNPVNVEKGNPRKTVIQIQKEREEKIAKAESEHAETALFQDAINAHKPGKKKPPKPAKPARD